MQHFSKSTDWFDDEKGWKSQQGGFSAVQKQTTDENNMGGFFVRKVCGAAALGVHLHKLMPLLFHPAGAQWVMGHFRPLFMASLIGNLAIVIFYGLYLEDLASAGADALPKCIMAVLLFETLVIAYYLATSRNTKRGPAVAMQDGKTPNSVQARIVMKTTMICSSMMSLIAARDLFFPGSIIDFLPRDDIYLEWTNAFFHSPPAGSAEDADQGLAAPLFIGDKFMSQLMALHILILCLYKIVSGCIRHGSDGSGLIKGKMMWKASALGNGFILLCFRLFAPAAASASLDLRWHLMVIAYETFILGMYHFVLGVLHRMGHSQ